ncbi:hypothetical protein ACWEPC_29670 [Nonomuraea sp. NPDC004297]
MLEVLGVDHWGEEAYLALVGAGPLAANEPAGMTTVEPDVLGKVLRRLEDRGLISRLPGQPARGATTTPDTREHDSPQHGEARRPLTRRGTTTPDTREHDDL